MNRMSVSRHGFIILSLLLLAWPASATAGVGPENVLLVVNPSSPASMCIANHYVQLRQIPADNVLYLPWNPNEEHVAVDAFRKKILLPILQTISDRRLGNQIDAVVYSSDFPWAVRLDADVQKFLKEMPQPTTSSKKPEWPTVLTPVGSINGLTYLWQPVLAGAKDYFDLQNNYYMREATGSKHEVSTAGFRGNRLYDKYGEVVASGGRRFFLSMMLGVTQGRGNTVPEVLDYLRRSVKADGTHPKGTIYFVQNSDIRSKVRHALFPDAVRELKSLGVAAEIVYGTVPMTKNDVQGVIMGTADFNWRASGSTILPGAICEHFTSYAGIMSSKASQTPLSEFLRYGAAGASGTVTEPYAIPQKFPSPMVQVHYARGCTLVEAFYQSIHGPYQQLIVGDPLCQPWAKIPRVSVEGVKSGETIKGLLKIKPKAAAAERFELFVDGVRLAQCKPGETLPLDTVKIADGYHELRIVAVGPAPIESQGRQIIPIDVANGDRKIKVALTGAAPWKADKPLIISVQSPGSKGILVSQGSRALISVKGAEGRIELPANALGAGPVRLRVVGLGDGDAASNVVAEPLDVTLE